jgi:hypothetical protein
MRINLTTKLPAENGEYGKTNYHLINEVFYVELLEDFGMARQLPDNATIQERDDYNRGKGFYFGDQVINILNETGLSAGISPLDMPNKNLFDMIGALRIIYDFIDKNYLIQPYEAKPTMSVFTGNKKDPQIDLNYILMDNSLNPKRVAVLSDKTILDYPTLMIILFRQVKSLEKLEEKLLRSSF